MTKFTVRLWLKNLRRYKFIDVDTLPEAQQLAEQKRRRGHKVKILKR